MKCATDGALRAFVDEELGRNEREDIQQHLRSCAGCKLRREQMVSESATVTNWLGALPLREEDSAIDPEAAYRQFRDQVESTPLRKARFGRWFEWSRRPVWSALGAACLLVLLLNFAPTRSWGQRFLQMLRIQKLAIVPVDVSAISQAMGGAGRANVLAKLVSDSVVVTQQPGKPTEVASPEQAVAQVAFPIRTLDSLGTPARILVEDEGAFHMSLDLDRIRAILQDAGRSDIQVPDSINGSIVAVHVSKGVAMEYGECKSQPTCISFLQVPTPAVSVPPNLNMAAIAEAGLQLSGMSAAEAKAFSKSVDWSSTLAIPVPLYGSSYRTVSVDGVNATVMERAPNGNFGEYSVMWMKNGVIYILGGKGTAERALAAAAALS